MKPPVDKPVPEEEERPSLSEEMPTHDEFFDAVERAVGFMHKREDPKLKVDPLRRRFPSPSYFIETNRYMLMRCGLPRLDAFYFTIIPGLARRSQRDSFGTKPLLNTVSLMAEYLKSLFIGVHIECFYIILLDTRGRLKNTVLAQKGTNDSAPFYMKQLLSIAVQREARAVVLCHNHPSGTLRPSKEDVACTLRMLRALRAMGIPMLDHIIIAGNRAVSMRELGIVPTQLWLLQNPKMKLVREWLDKDLL